MYVPDYSRPGWVNALRWFAMWVGLIVLLGAVTLLVQGVIYPALFD